MNTEAWCGSCGESFRLAQVVEEGEGARCPRCGLAYNPGYTAVVVTAVNQFVKANEVMHQALQQLADLAPLLHVDREALYKSLDTYLQR